MTGALGVRTAFGGQKVQSMAQRAKLAQAHIVQGAAVTQRLKPGKPPGTQRLTPKQAPSLPSGTQVKKKVCLPGASEEFEYCVLGGSLTPLRAAASYHPLACSAPARRACALASRLRPARACWRAWSSCACCPRRSRQVYCRWRKGMG